MFHIDEAEINHIRENADIVEIVSSYIPLTQKGKNYFGVCPFHEDHSPSMSVSREKGIYKCFSCGATGNVFKFVGDYENINFAEAVKRVADKIGLSLKSTIKIQKEKKNEIEYKVMELSSLLFQNNLITKEGEQARTYLEQRGLNEEAIKDFQIGLSLEKNQLYEFLHQKKYEDQMLYQLGLTNQSNGNNYDIFIQRIMFPIHNANGEVVGFTGRIYLPESSPPKYLNSKETIIFKKGNILFNYHRAKDAIRLKKQIILVEGNMDAIRMYHSGFKNTIALMGTSLTTTQIGLLKKLRAPILLMLDNDDAGNIATYQIGTLLEKENIPISVVRLSGEKDPDEYIIKNGVDAMEENLKNAISFLDFKITYYKQNKNLKDSEELVTYIKKVLESMKDSTDQIKKEITLKKLSDTYGISLEILKEELEKLEVEQKKTTQNQETPKSLQKKPFLSDSVNHILYFMMNDAKYIKMYKSKLGFLDDATSRGIANEIMAYYEIHQKINFADFLTAIETSKLKEAIYEIIEQIKDEKMSEWIMEEYIDSVKRKRKQNEIKLLKEQQKNEFDVNKKLKIGLRIQELKKEV